MPEHTCERIVDVEGRLLDEMHGIVAETKEKIKSCEAASTDLESVLSELQLQRDNASDLIKESYQSYKSMLEKRQVHRLLHFCTYLFSYNDTCGSSSVVVPGFLVWDSFNDQMCPGAVK